MGSTYAPWDHFAEWKKINSEGEVGVVSLETALRGTCDPYRLLDLVENFVTYTPAYPYRILSDSQRALRYVEARGLRFRYYSGPVARNLPGPGAISLGELGEYRVRPVPGLVDTVELLSGPGTGR